MKPLIFCILLSLFTFPFTCLAEGLPPSATDSIKYKGYRLELTNFRLVKRTNDWIKVGFDVVNSGRMNVDVGRKGTEHWVVFNFDQSIFSLKLGGYREHIKIQMAKEGFRLEKGKLKTDILLKIPTVLPSPPRTTQKPVARKKPPAKPNAIEEAASNLSWNTSNAPTINDVEFSKKEASQNSPPPAKPAEIKTCPDIFISNIKIIKQESKFATIEYTVTNQGTGSFYLYGKNAAQKDLLLINAYLSGVSTLTRGALPIGGEVVTKEIRSINELKKGEGFTGRIKVDIRKKTRYMKSLILNLESGQFALECDRKNNDRGIVLE